MCTTKLILGIVILMFVVGFHGVVADETLTVINTNDSGDGSLRWAIEQANISTGEDTIEFNIPSTDSGYNDITGVWTIQPTSALPIIPRYHWVIIDGYSQPGAQLNTNTIIQDLKTVPKIELDGSNAGAGTDGLVITAGISTVRGLVINRFDGNGILLEKRGNNVIEGNYIGTDVTGLANLGNGLSGICIHNSIYNTVGPNNVLSFNGGDGVYIEGAPGRNMVDGNTFTDNARDGLRIENVHDGFTEFTNNIIKSNIAGIHVINFREVPTIEGNIIEDNTEAGILIEDIGGVLRKTMKNNVITQNLTGIYLRPPSPTKKSQNLSTLNITHNNIYSNTNYGLLNEDPTVTVVANSNWWGDASGPYDEDTNPDGQGNAIAGNVMCSNWLSTIHILSISSVADAWGIPGAHVYVDFQIYSLDSCSHTFDMIVIDSLDWHLIPYEFSITFEGMADTIVSIMVTIPQETELETENTILLSGTSTHDPAIIGSGDAKVIVMVGGRADLNTDGSINVLDAIRVVNIIIGIGDPPNAYENWAADCNGDGTVNALDLLGIVNVILGIGECTP